MREKPLLASAARAFHATTLCLAISITSAGCGDGSVKGSGPPSGDNTTGLQSISVTPENATLNVQVGTPATATYQATGHYADGSTRDLSTNVTFSLENSALGAFSGAALTTASSVGGHTQVVATMGTVEGRTPLKLILSQSINDPNSATMPAAPETLFTGAVSGSHSPSIVYPNNNVLLPPNLARLELHFLPGAGNTLFQLSFSNTVTDVRVHLRCRTQVANGCVYELPTDLWNVLSLTNRGDEAVTVQLRGTNDAGAYVGVASPINISFSADVLRGGLYYWTTSQGTGIMRYDFGSSQTAPEKYLGTELSGGTCVGCHALSRDGRKLIAEAGGQNDGRLLLLDVATKTPLVAFGSPPKSIFESWNHDGSAYVGVYGDTGAVNFNLRLFDGNDGHELASVNGTGTSQNPANHPDWSADGQKIAYVKVGEKGTLQRFGRGAIMMVEGNGTSFGSPIEIVPAMTGRNRYYPAFAPDSSFVIFNESRCPNTVLSADCNAETDPSALLFAALARQGATPINMARANAGGVMDGSTMELTNTYAKWSPFVFQRTNEDSSRLMWVTFSSSRNYGLRSPPAGAAVGLKGTLLWMAAVDPDKVASGQDPSYPAFALPFQDLATSNHIAQWTTAVVPTID